MGLYIRHNNDSQGISIGYAGITAIVQIQHKLYMLEANQHLRILQ